MDFLRRGFKTIGFKGDYLLGLMDDRHVLIRFQLQEDYQRCWLHQTWKFKTHKMRVLKWTSFFHKDEEPPIAPIWVAFENLPLFMFKKEALFSAGQIIGKPLKMDAATENLSRPLVARLCVEVDLLKTFPRRFWIGQGATGFWQSIKYESIPDYCCGCRRFGHIEEICGQKEWRQKTAAIGPENAANQTQVNGNLETIGAQPEEKNLVPAENNPGLENENIDVDIAFNPTIQGGSTHTNASQVSADTHSPHPARQNATATAIGKIIAEPVTTAYEKTCVASFAGLDAKGNQHPLIDEINAADIPPSPQHVTPEPSPAVPSQLIVAVSPSSDEDHSLVIVGNRFSILEGLDDQVQNREGVHAAVPPHMSTASETPFAPAMGESAVQLPHPSTNHLDIPVEALNASAAVATVTNTEEIDCIDSPAIHQLELVVMLSPIIPVPTEPAAQDQTTAGVVSKPMSKPLNVEAVSWYPRSSASPSFSNVTEPQFDDNNSDGEEGTDREPQFDDNDSNEEEGTDRDSHEDFLDSQSVRDDLYLEKRKKRHVRQERDVVQFRGRERPLGSRNRMFFDLERTMSTRSRTLD